MKDAFTQPFDLFIQSLLRAGLCHVIDSFLRYRILNAITGKIKEGDATAGQVYKTCLTVSMYCEPAPPSKRQDRGHDANITEKESCLLSSAQVRITGPDYKSIQ